jgi:hypothetical protein
MGVSNSKPKSNLLHLIATQGNEGSCYAHSTSKLIVKNIFENCISLQLNALEEKEFLGCFHINTETISTDITSLSSKTCGTKGYYKILLFLYNYFTMTEKYGCNGGNTIEALYSSVSDLYNPIKLPHFFKQSVHSSILLQLLEQVKSKLENVSYEIIEILNEDGIIFFIETLIDTGLYVNLILEKDILSEKYTDSYIKKFGKPSHSVTIVDYTKNTFIIQNSWSKSIDTINYEDVPTFFYLEGTSFTVKSAVCILPMFKDTKRYDYVKSQNEPPVIDKEIWPQEFDAYKEWIIEYCRALKKSKWIKW